MALTAAQRIELGLDDPPPGYNAPAPVQEFLPAQSANGAQHMSRQPPASPPNPRLQLSTGEKATPAKIRGMVNELLAMNIETANNALQQLFLANPKVGLETYIELSKFALPQLKAIAVQVDDRSDNPRALTFQQLQSALAADG